MYPLFSNIMSIPSILSKNISFKDIDLSVDNQPILYFLYVYQNGMIYNHSIYVLGLKVFYF